ncbi:MAG: TatD family hydrolase [Ignavibacteria bacterium]|nr:TatD family hydrolase [Ignavibacteria bacterium]
MYVNVHCHHSTENENVLAVLNVNAHHLDALDSTRLCSVGIHPWDTPTDVSHLYDEVPSAAEQDNVIAIGECGLDPLQGGSMGYQCEVFEWHVELSERTRKPLIIHCVRAFADLLRIRKYTSATAPWIIHGFNKSVGLAEQMIDNDLYVSLGTFLMQNNSKVHEVCMKLPADRMFLETDNDVATSIEQLYGQVAQLRKISTDELCKIQLSNFKTVFNQ